MDENELEFETVSNDETPQAKESSLNVSELFSGFPPPKVETPPTPSEKPNEAESVRTSNDWEGNPLYYQSGIKQGQLKPSAGGQPTTSNKSKASKTPEPPQPPKGMLVTGTLLMGFVDIVFPFLIAGGHNLATKKEGEKIERLDLKLTPDQKSEFGPIFNECAEYLKLHLPPALILAGMIGTAYSTNYAKALANNKKKPKND